jgi:hypothetical protein
MSFTLTDKDAPPYLTARPGPASYTFLEKIRSGQDGRITGYGDLDNDHAAQAALSPDKGPS